VKEYPVFNYIEGIVGLSGGLVIRLRHLAGSNIVVSDPLKLASTELLTAGILAEVRPEG